MEESRSSDCVRRKSVHYLPTELLCSIGFKLDSAADRVRFRAVSKSWRSALPFRQPPWLVLPKSMPSEESQKVIKLFEFITVGDQTISTVDLPEINEARIVGSMGNWLITLLEVDESVCLLNPFSKLQFQLPSHFQPLHQLSTTQLRDRFVSKVVLSSSPRNATDPNCIAMAIHWSYHKLTIARLGEASWTDVATDCLENGFNNYFEDVVYYDRRFYGITSNRNLVVCNNEDGLNPPNVSFLFECFVDEFGCSYNQYLVECSGELLLVVRYADPIFTNFEEPKHRTTSFKTYKVDFANMDIDEVKSLGNHSLFLGRNTSVSVLASDYFGLVRKNCIYFTDEIFVTDVGDYEYVRTLIEEDIGMFNMEDNSITPHYKGTSNSLFSLPVWIIPT